MFDLPVFVTVLFLASLCLTTSLGWIVGRALWSRRWPSVPGKILAASVQEGSTLSGDLDSPGGMQASTFFLPLVSYAYEVNGNAYEGKAISGFAAFSFADRARAEAMVAQWVPGTVVPVYYRPSRPRQARLIHLKFPRLSAILLGLSLLPLWWTARLFWAFAA